MKSKLGPVGAIVMGTSVVVTIGVVVALGGCNKATEPFKDAGRGNTNSSTADTGTMPDGFSNWSTKCDHGNRVYVVFHGDSPYGAIAVVPNDETCPQN